MRIKSRDSNTHVTYVIHDGDFDVGRSKLYMKTAYLRRFISDVRYHRVRVVHRSDLTGRSFLGSTGLDVEGIERADFKSEFLMPRYVKLVIRSDERAWSIYFFDTLMSQMRRTHREVTH
jgi:hypothetical protein